MNKIYKTQSDCKICGIKGSLFFSEKFLNPSNIKFINKFYYNKFFKFLNKAYFKDFKYNLYICEKCDFIWQEKSLKKKYSFILYEKIIDVKYSLKKNKNKYENNSQFQLEKYLLLKTLSPKSKILDIGAGWGEWLFKFKNNFRSFALEFSLTRKKYLKKRGLSILDYENRKKHLNSFKVVKADQVLEHIDTVNLFMKNIVQLIDKRERLLIISVPNGRKLLNYPNNIYYEKGPIQPLEHLNCFTNKSLVKLMYKYGFKRIGVFKFLRIYIPYIILNPFRILNLTKKFYDQYYGTSVVFE